MYICTKQVQIICAFSYSFSIRRFQLVMQQSVDDVWEVSCVLI